MDTYLVDGVEVKATSHEEAFEKVFKKGDKLIRLTGMDYPVDLTPEELLICPFCGNIFPTENKVCIECNEPALNDTAIGEISF